MKLACGPRTAILVTVLTSQLLSCWLKRRAWLNKPDMLVHFATFHWLMSWLKAEPYNIICARASARLRLGRDAETAGRRREVARTSGQCAAAAPPRERGHAAVQQGVERA